MKDIDKVFNTAINEIERMINTKTVVGEPMTVDGHTLIPLISVGFGFGVGGGDNPGKNTGTGGGTGGGGGIRPIALVIINQDGVRVETIKGGAATAMEKMAETISKAVAKSKEDESQRQIEE